MNRYPVEVTLILTVEAPNAREAVARANDAVTIRPVDDDVEVHAVAVEVSRAEIEWPAPTPSETETAALELNRRMVEALERQAPKREGWDRPTEDGKP